MAGVDQQAETEGEVALRGKALDHLRAAVFGEGEVFGRQVGDQCTVLVLDHHGEQNFARLHLEGGVGLLGRGGRGGLLCGAGWAQKVKRKDRNGRQRENKAKS